MFFPYTMECHYFTAMTRRHNHSHAGVPSSHHRCPHMPPLSLHTLQAQITHYTNCELITAVQSWINRNLCPKESMNELQIHTKLLGSWLLQQLVLSLIIATPVLLLFSPVLVPAGIVLFLVTAGFLFSGACGVAAI